MTKHKLDPTKIAATSFDGASNFSSAKGGVHCAGICFRHHTYVCEQFFSSMKLNKSALRSRLADEHRRATLRLATAHDIKPSLDVLV